MRHHRGWRLLRRDRRQSRPRYSQDLPNEDQVRVGKVVSLCEGRVRSAVVEGNSTQGVTSLDGVGTAAGGWGGEGLSGCR